jgi:glutamate:GABA antiporter
LCAVFFEWIAITIGLVAVAYFLVGSLAYFFDFPALNHNLAYKYLLVIAVFSVATLLSFLGMKFIARLAMLGVIIGIVVPVITLLVLTILYTHSGAHIHLYFGYKNLLPHFSGWGSLSTLVVFILSFFGIEANAVHVNQLKDVRKVYPMLMIAVVIFSLILALVGTLPISMLIEKSEIDLDAGILQVYNLIAAKYHIEWLTRVMAFCLAFGAFSMILSWIQGPINGLLVAANDNLIPACFKKVNKHGISTNLTLFQGAVLFFWATVFTFSSLNGNASFLISIHLASAVFLTMYLILYVAYAKAKVKFPDIKRGYKIPMGKLGATIAFVLGVITVFISLIFTFLPPEGTVDVATYSTILVISFFVVLAIPQVIFRLDFSEK